MAWTGNLDSKPTLVLSGSLLKRILLVPFWLVTCVGNHWDSPQVPSLAPDISWLLQLNHGWFPITVNTSIVHIPPRTGTDKI